ncbi:MAG: hypothetical protein OQL19_16925 [Gammaproteobacteria bacterium]|nr:hypothetical protein [Gammaproteobacteria bacterium]
MEGLKIFLDIGKTLKIIRISTGQIQLRFSLYSLPLIKQLSVVPPFNHITVDQFINSLDGINHIKVNQFLASATIQYDTSIWCSTMWESFCNGKDNPDLIKKISEAIEKTS